MVHRFDFVLHCRHWLVYFVLSILDDWAINFQIHLLLSPMTWMLMIPFLTGPRLIPTSASLKAMILTLQWASHQVSIFPARPNFCLYSRDSCLLARTYLWWIGDESVSLHFLLCIENRIFVHAFLGNFGGFTLWPKSWRTDSSVLWYRSDISCALWVHLSTLYRSLKLYGNNKSSISVCMFLYKIPPS